MRQSVFVGLLLLSGCTHKTVQAPDLDAPKYYQLPPMIRGQDYVCAVDGQAPELRSCMRISVFRDLLNSLRAEP